jgi:hypothetical protein
MVLQGGTDMADQQERQHDADDTVHDEQLVRQGASSRQMCGISNRPNTASGGG